MIEVRQLCLTLDLENDWYFRDPGLDHLVFDHLEEFIALIDDLSIPISVFVVGRTLERYPEAVERIRTELDSEFHLHSYRHDTSKSVDFEADVRAGLEIYEDFFGRPPRGYRAPQGAIEPREFRILEELSFDFDSSVFPSYRPGKYNNLTAPTEPFVPDTAATLIEIPIGTFPRIRVPTAHSYFKFFGRPLESLLTVSPLPHSLVYNVHLHDLYRTKSHDALDVPKRWIMKRNMGRSIAMFRRNIRTLRSRGYQPVRMTRLYEQYRQQMNLGKYRAHHEQPVSS